MSPYWNRTILDTSAGSTVKTLTIKQAGKTEIPVAPAEEQTRIVTAIESIQQRSARARALLTEVNTLLTNLRQSMLQAAFSGRLTADWRAKNPDVEPADQLLVRIRTERRQRWETAELEKFKAKGKKPPKNWKDKYKEPDTKQDNGEFESEYKVNESSDWKFTSLETLVDPEKNIPYGIVKTGDPYDEGVPTVRCGDIKQFSIAIDDLKLVDPEVHEQYKRTWLEGGEVLIAIRGTVGETAVVPSSMSGMNISREVALIPVLPGIDATFLMYLLASPQAQRLIFGQVKGVAQSGINLSDLRILRVPVPPVNEQLEITKRIEEAMERIASVIEVTLDSNSRLEKLDQSILSKAFRGELVPQDPNDEPAAELLARIRATREAAETKKKTTRKKKAKKKATRKQC